MTLRRSHGTAAHRVVRPLVVETLPPVEQPVGIARPHAGNTGAGREGNGRFRRSTDPTEAGAARELGRLGGEGRAGWRAAADSAQLGPIAASPLWRSYASAAVALADAHLSELRALVSAGKAPAGLRALVRLFALQTVAARWAFEQGAARVEHDPKFASALFQQGNRWTESARSTLLTVHELAVRMVVPTKRTGGSVADLHARLARVTT